MQRLMRRFARDSKGATAIEYGLIASLVVVAIFGALTLFGSKAIGMWTNIATIVSAS